MEQHDTNRDEYCSATDRSPAAPRAGFGDVQVQALQYGGFGVGIGLQRRRISAQECAVCCKSHFRALGIALRLLEIPVVRLLDCVLSHSTTVDIGNRLKIAIENAIFSTEASESRRSEKYDEQVYGWNRDSEMSYW